jgi:hypothetical protein
MIIEDIPTPCTHRTIIVSYSTLWLQSVEPITHSKNDRDIWHPGNMNKANSTLNEISITSTWWVLRMITCTTHRAHSERGKKRLAMKWKCIAGLSNMKQTSLRVSINCKVMERWNASNYCSIRWEIDLPHSAYAFKHVKATANSLTRGKKALSNGGNLESASWEQRLWCFLATLDLNNTFQMQTS